MNKQSEYTEDGGSELPKKKKKKVPNPFKALKKFKKKNPDLFDEGFGPPSKKQMRADGVLPPKKKRAGTGNHPMSK
jgi:hypothetical protein